MPECDDESSVSATLSLQPAPYGFVTSHLDLRPLAHTDLDHLAEIYAVPAVAKHLTGGVPGLAEILREVSAFEEHWATYGFGQSALIERSTGRFVGRAGLRVREPWDDIELTCVIDRDRQRRGYATEAGRAWVAWARQRGLAERLVVVIAPREEASRRTARTLGFRSNPARSPAWAGGRPAFRLPAGDEGWRAS